MTVLLSIYSLFRQTGNADWYLVGTTIALVLATIALVGITAYYARQTKRLVTQTGELVKTPFLPRLSAHYDPKMQIEGQYISNIVLHIKNIGVGTAIDIKVQYSIPSLDKTDQKQYASIHPSGAEDWSIPVSQPKRDKEIQIILEYEYRDLLVRKYMHNQTLIIRSYALD
ncbi:hypothetical protein BH18THE2_BH18THE2_43590 [soil metagenome]